MIQRIENDRDIAYYLPCFKTIGIPQFPHDSIKSIVIDSICPMQNIFEVLPFLTAVTMATLS